MNLSPLSELPTTLPLGFNSTNFLSFPLLLSPSAGGPSPRLPRLISRSESTSFSSSRMADLWLDEAITESFVVVESLPSRVVSSSSVEVGIDELVEEEAASSVEEDGTSVVVLLEDVGIGSSEVVVDSWPTVVEVSTLTESVDDAGLLLVEDEKLVVELLTSSGVVEAAEVESLELVVDTMVVAFSDSEVVVASSVVLDDDGTSVEVEDKGASVEDTNGVVSAVEVVGSSEVIVEVSGRTVELVVSGPDVDDSTTVKSVDDAEMLLVA